MPTEVITAAAATGNFLLEAAGAYAISTGINILFIRRLLRNCRIKVSAFPCLSVTVSRKDERREAGLKSLIDAILVDPAGFASAMNGEDESEENGEDDGTEAEKTASAKEDG